MSFDFKYLKHKDIDYCLWDDCIDHSENGIIYALSWYLNITTPHWDGIVKESGGKYMTVMPIPIYKKFGISYIKQPVFSQQLGVFHREENLNEKEIEEILELLKKRVRYIQRYEFNTASTAIVNSQLKGFTVNIFKTFHLDLNRPYNEIVKGYKTDRKWRINKAKRSGILIKESDDIDLLIEVFDKNVAHKIYGIVGEKYEYKILKELYYATKARELNTLYSAQNSEGRILAMGLFFKYNNKIIYIFNASTQEGKQLGAISLVVDKVLHDNSNKQLCFDFESPEVPKVAEFYQRFGSTVAPFASVSYNYLPLGFKIIKKARFYVYRKFMELQMK